MEVREPEEDDSQAHHQDEVDLLTGHDDSLRRRGFTFQNPPDNNLVPWQSAYKSRKSHHTKLSARWSQVLRKTRATIPRPRSLAQADRQVAAGTTSALE